MTLFCKLSSEGLDISIRYYAFVVLLSCFLFEIMTFTTNQSDIETWLLDISLNCKKR